MNEFKRNKNHFLNSVKTTLIGLIWIFIAIWLVFELSGNPLDELALIRHAAITDGFIVDAWEDVGDHDNGRPIWFHGGTYTYQLPDGRKFKQTIKEGTGRLKTEFRNLEYHYPIKVEYLPNKPNISRIKGSGYKSIKGWIIKITAGAFLLILFSAPGFILLWYGLCKLKVVFIGKVNNYNQEQINELLESIEA